MRNQRLLLSVYDAQEAREAILGGARVIDCEDPIGALGDISPRRIMMIADAILGYKKDSSLQISTNIGENQLLFKRDDVGRSLRSGEEIAGKAAQAALGVAAAMGTDIHPVNIVKVGLDGMPDDLAFETLQEVVRTLDRSAQFSRTQVVAVFFAQNLAYWEQRKDNPTVIRDLLLHREYIVDRAGNIDIQKMFGDSADDMTALRDKLGQDTALFKEAKVLIPGVRVRTTQLSPRKPLGFSEEPLEWIRQAIDLTARAGADGVMIDTRIHSKIARLCFLNEGTDRDKPDPQSKLALQGLYSLEELAECVRYCHHKGLEFWASGSIQPYQAAPIWALGDGEPSGRIDGMAVRGGATTGVRAWQSDNSGRRVVVTRASKRVYRDLVEAFAAPTR